jgi:diketogulonate reductase-like aldo/keto reductase
MIVLIPRTKRRAHLDKNPDSLEVWLTAKELARINEFSPRGVTAGARYLEVAMKFVEI